MSQTMHADVRAYAVGEMSEADKRSAAAHVSSCEACREELAGVQATLGSLAMLRDEEVPRRIAFVSDKVFEPTWWQKLNPMFASAALIAAAIVAHGYMTPAPATVDAAVIQEKLEQVSAQNEDLMLLYRQQQQQVQQLVKSEMKLVSY